ncbi:MAG: hypothetical protein ACJ0BN_11840 [Limisphaerales bacterium]
MKKTVKPECTRRITAVIRRVHEDAGKSQYSSTVGLDKLVHLTT